MKVSMLDPALEVGRFLLHHLDCFGVTFVGPMPLLATSDACLVRQPFLLLLGIGFFVAILGMVPVVLSFPVNLIDFHGIAPFLLLLILLPRVIGRLPSPSVG